MQLTRLTALVALASACSTVPASTAPPRGACPIIGSSDWAAWIDAMPGPQSQPRLIVTGKVQAPTGGYRFELGDMRIMESHPVQVVVEVRQLPSPSPGAPVTLIVENHELRGEWPMGQPVGSVTVRCENTTIARVAPVETAH